MLKVFVIGRKSRVCRLCIACAIGAAVCIWSCFCTKKKQGEAREQNKHVPYGPYEACFKRPFDVLLSGAALILLSPVMAAAGVIIYCELGKPVIFRQERPGKDEKIFEIRKFRSMLEGRGSDEERLTGFGKKLRATSIDELPELWNIFVGDMSVAGPRPLLVEYLPRYSERQRHRHDVRPGLTGLAQVSGRNELSWDEKFEDDLRYVEKITFLGDVKILIDTMKIVFKKEGISSRTSETMEVFTGSESK